MVENLYCEILDNETGLVQVGVGCPEEYYQEIGMQKRNVEQSEKDFQWYLEGKCPHFTLEETKQIKYEEALMGAKEFIEYQAVYQFDNNNSIEATDGNIGKMTAYALAFQTGTLDKVYWTSKEDNVLELDANDVLDILTGLGEIQSAIWNVKFVAYKNAINNASTIQEVQQIVINYAV
jgi:hypothetical protein